MSPLTPDELVRYRRHVLLDQIGVEGQQRLKAGRVLVVGAGGLGSPAALYLAAAGIGRLGVADFDRVETHNLHRQLLHDDTTVGQPKVASAARRLRATNPFVEVIEHPEGLTAQNALALFSAYDVIVDGTDTFATRYLINDAAVATARPLVSGNLFKFEGSVSVFAPHLGGPCYRCLFPHPPPVGAVPNCGEAGVLGALCGVIGSLQALEAIKLIAGFGEPLLGRVAAYDALDQTLRRLNLPRDPRCVRCATPAARRSPLQPVVQESGASAPATASGAAAGDVPQVSVCPPPFSPMPSSESVPLEIDVEQTKALLDSQPGDVRLIDVREPYEADICRIEGATLIPMRQIPEHLDSLPSDQHLLIHCHHGGRSLRVTEFLRSRGYPRVSNVAGGIDAWAERIDPRLRRY